MKNITYKLLLVVLLTALYSESYSQQGAPYCVGGVTTGTPCSFPGPSNSPNQTYNDFINSVNTCGGNTNIINNNSGCSGLANNYIYYNNSNPLVAAPGQTITFNVQSGTQFPQGFAIFIDWNNNGVFDMPGERVGATAGVPPANTFTSISVVIPLGTPLGTYRLRIRSQFSQPGTATTPCGSQNYGETEDYDLTVVGNNTAPIATDATLTTNAPICAGQTLSVNLVTNLAVLPALTWSGPNNFTSTAQNIAIPNATINMSGVYSVTLANGGCPVTKTISAQVIPYPVVNVTPVNAVVCQGGSYLASLTSANPSLYHYQWSGNAAFVTPTLATTQINTYPINTLTKTETFSVVITPTILNCPITVTLDVLINNPPTPTLTMPPPMCNTSPVTFATGLPPGGSWYGNPNISTSGIISPAGATNFGSFPASYSVTVGSCTAHSTGNISISKYNTAAITGALPQQCVLDRPTNLLTLVQNPSGVWSGVGVSANTFTPTGLPTNTYLLNYYNPSTPFANVCPATNTLLISVFNPQTPNIGPIPLKCTNQASVSLSLLATPFNGVWSGNAGITPYGVYTPGMSSNLAGVNSVTYTAGQGTCVASSSATFFVATFNSSALNISSLNLCVTTNSIELRNLATGSVSGMWSAPTSTSGLTGTGTPTAPYFFNPAGLPSGLYTLTYSTKSNPDVAQCADSTLLPITVLNPIQPTIGLAGPFCSVGSPFQLSVNAPTGYFVASSYLSASGMFYPNLGNIGTNQVQYVVGTPTCNVSDIKQISVEAFVSPTIGGLVPDLCITSQAFNLLPLTTTTLGTWSGPGVTGLLFNPTLAGYGSHILYYSTASSPSGLCPASSSLAAMVYTLAPPFIEKEGPFCNSGPSVKLRASPLNGIFGNGPSIDALGVFNPAFAAIGDNIISYSVSAGPCVAYTNTVIKIEKFISADLVNPPIAFCKYENGVDLTPVAQNPGGVWSGPGLTGNYFTPLKANTGNNNFLVYTTQSETFDLCPDTTEIRVRVDDVPDVKITSDPPFGCSPVVVTFNNQSTNTGSGEWTLGDGSATMDGLSVIHTYTAPGTYSVVFNYKNDIGCKNQGVLYNAVTVFESPRAGFRYDPYQEVTISDPEVHFINQTLDVGKTTYQWQIDNLYSLSEVNPVVIFPGKGEYRITLKATSINNCVSEVSDIIVVKPEFDLFVPNSFSPNFDGLNDVFLPVFSPYGLDTKTFDMEIFDRWGHSIFHTKDMNRGWDGSLQNKGEPLKEEIYVYRLKYKDLQGKIYNKQGYVTMVK